MFRRLNGSMNAVLQTARYDALIRDLALLPFGFNVVLRFSRSRQSRQLAYEVLSFHVLFSVNSRLP
jgi:hypothetical protein